MTQPKRQQAIERFDGEYRFLSNFHPSPIVMPSWHPCPGRMAPTVEHAFQAAKAEIPLEAAFVLAAMTPGQAKRLGRGVMLRAGWEEGRDVIMEALLMLKFAPGSELAKMLVDTGDAELVEGNHWGDTYWGVCRGVGANKLGKILMDIRSSLALIEVSR